jgi:hypothetical protein
MSDMLVVILGEGTPAQVGDKLKHIGHLQAGKSRPQFDHGRLSVNCSDWPVANCVLLPERRSTMQ